MSFSDDMSAAKADLLSGMAAARNAAIVAMTDRIIDDTPVLTGALRGSWHTAVNEPVYVTEPTVDPTGMSSKAEVQANLGGLDDDVFFTNALPYSEVIEYDGHSSKAPEGMVRKNLAMWPDLPAILESSRNG